MMESNDQQQSISRNEDEVAPHGNEQLGVAHIKYARDGIGEGDTEEAYSFPMKLHQLLQQTEETSERIASWMPGGRSFQIHQKEKFAKLFSTSYEFIRQHLFSWGFHPVTKGPMKGAWFHPCFQQECPQLCENMYRAKPQTKFHDARSRVNSKSFTITDQVCQQGANNPKSHHKTPEPSSDQQPNANAGIASDDDLVARHPLFFMD